MIQPDGKIVLLGNVNENQQVLLARILASGTPDASFGTAGIATYTPPPAALSEKGEALALQPDGRIVVAGWMFRSNFGSSYRQALEVKRYNANGSVDTSFGAGGTVETWMVNSSLRARDVAIDGAGNIVVAGCIEASGDSFSTCPDGTGQSDFLVARYTPTGTLDSTFGANGLKTVDFSGFGDGASGLALQTNGKIIAAGYSSADGAGQEDFALVRLLGGAVSCGYTLSGTAASVGPGAGSGTVTVTTPNGCHWSTTSNASWIVITSGSSGSGSGTVTYVYGPNPLTATRAAL